MFGQVDGLSEKPLDKYHGCANRVLFQRESIVFA